MRNGSNTRHLTEFVVILSVILAACGTPNSEATSTAPATTTTLQETTTTAGTSTTGSATTTTTGAEPAANAAYFLLMEEADGGPFLVPVYRRTTGTEDPAMTVMQLLVEGPTPDETAGTPSISTAMPEGTNVLSVTIDAGLATVDLSGEYDDGGGSLSMFARLAQVVYTLTAIAGVEGVIFELDGEPVTVFSSEGIELDGPQQREDYYDLLPAIFVDSPAWGEPVTSPIEVRGLSNVFEAVSQVMLTDDDGLPLFEDTVMATCGTGCWGEWEIEIPYSVDREQFGALIVWEFSAADGSRINVREYPIQLR